MEQFAQMTQIDEKKKHINYIQASTLLKPLKLDWEKKKKYDYYYQHKK